MSTGMRIARAEALDLANHVMDLLKPFCKRIEIAGSLRRGRPDVGDIELVCIPDMVEAFDLFGSQYPIENRLFNSGILGYLGKCIKGGDHYRQYNLDICNLDLFITTPEQWGVIFMIRTGSAEFTRRMVTPRSHGGLMPSNMRVSDGRLWRVKVRNGLELMNDEPPLVTPEETDIFDLYGMKFIPPEQRNDDNGTKSR